MGRSRCNGEKLYPLLFRGGRGGYNFICRKQRKNESLEQFHADSVELAVTADCGDREEKWIRDIFTADSGNQMSPLSRKQRAYYKQTTNQQNSDIPLRKIRRETWRVIMENIQFQKDG